MAGVRSNARNSGQPITFLSAINLANDRRGQTMILTRRLTQLKQSLFGYPQARIAATATDYDSYWKQKRSQDPLTLSSFQLSRAKIVGSLIKPHSSVTDIGAGNCAILHWLIRHHFVKAHAVDCSDFSQNCAKTLGIEFTKINLNNSAELSKIPDADYLILLELIEHLPSPESLLPLLMQKADRGIVFSVPNSGYFIDRLRYLFGRTPCQWMVHPGEHLRFWTTTDLRWWLSALGVSSAQREIYFYQGLPLLNRVLPSLFAKAIVVLIKTTAND